MPDDRPVFIVDLDGTLLSVNSFRVWATFMLRGRLPHLRRRKRVQLRIAVGAGLLLRRARLIDHDRVRSQLQQRWTSVTAGDAGAAERTFQAELLGHVREELRPLVAGVTRGEVDAILATAAAAEYAEPLGARLGFREVVATPRWSGSPCPANRGSRKREAVLARLRDVGWTGRPLVLLTDHRDDLPLIRVCGVTYWFGDDGARQDVRRDAVAASILPGDHFAGTLARRDPA